MQTGDELSKRSKFVFCTWIGDKVKVMEKAKMGTDKALVKAVIEVGMMVMVMMADMMVMVIKYNDDKTNEMDRETKTTLNISSSVNSEFKLHCC